MADHLIQSNRDTSHGLVSTVLDQLQYGLGYRAYRSKEHMRQDDQLIRDRACSILLNVKASMQDRASEWRRKNIVCTAENPVPSQEKLDIAREMTDTINQLAALESQVRNAAMPVDSSDRLRHCQSSVYLPQFQMLDSDLLQSVLAVEDLVESSEYDPLKKEKFNQLLKDVKDSLSKRQETFSGFLSI